MSIGGFIWLHTGLTGIQIINKSSLLCIKQRIFDNVTQSLYADIENSKKCIFYKYLIDGFHIQHYLRKAIPSKYQKIISKFKLLQLFNSENFTELCNLGRFLLLAMKRRNCLQIID